MSTAAPETSAPDAPNAPVGPIDLASVPAEDRDRVWYDNYYQGDIPQMTFRAVMMGGLIGAAMSITNLYTTLKLGWAFGVGITACVLSYTLWKPVVSMGFSRTQMSILETNCMQSTASAAGYSTGGTLATAAGALLLMTGDEGRMGWVPTTIWVFLVAILGVFLAIPMKRQMINQEQLPFPSGIAAAETLKSLYAEGQEAVHKAQALINSLIAGLAVGALRSFGVIPEALPFHGAVMARGERRVSLEALGVSFEPSLLLVAAGMIVGMRVSVSMMLGALLNWFVLAPYVMGLDDWSQEGKVFIGHFEAVLAEDGTPAVVRVTRWSLWLGTSLMVTSGLTSFALGWRTILRAFTGLSKGGASGHDAKLAAIEVPNSWFVVGLIPTTIGLVALSWFAFQISPLLGLVSVALSFAISLVASRATGETDTTPVGAMGKITQLIYAVLAPANGTANLLSAGITAGAAGASADLLTDLKAGYLLGANPRQQFLAQLSGVFFGTLAVVPAWYLLVPDKAALEAFNPPATNMWFAVAEALSNGIGTIPSSARLCIVIGGLVGILLPLTESLFPKARPYLPSAMGLGLAFVVSFANSLAFFIGAVIAWRWAVADSKSSEKYVVPLASGAVAGESLSAAAYAILNGLRIIVPL
jgi:uncharacterized oligopeptide transporter (OPT) family protein